jgi:LPXTG-motif cell wall-anchored protein
VGVRLFRAVRAAAASGVVACLAVLTLPASPAHAAPEPVGFFADSATPAVPNWDDAASIEVGVRFSSDVDGTVSALRFYKGDKNTGTHAGSIWSADGVLLATATFTDETASGWQKVSFDTPVEIRNDTTYLASYHTPVGFYSVTLDQFTPSGITSGPLHIAANGGAYRYGATGFPDQTSPHNYWIDVVFREKKVDPEPSEPAPSGSPSVGATAAPGAGGGESLPTTGVDTPLVAGAGMLLAAIGGLLAWRHRRRTTRFVA